MQTKFLFIILFLLFQTFKNETTLTIEISNLKNSDGQILLELSDTEKNVVKEITQEIKADQCLIIVENLKPGNYSFRYFHDENTNKKLDTNIIGMPKEGFGFSNNAMGKFGPPKHEKTIFNFTSDTTMKCTPIYLK